MCFATGPFVFRVRSSVPRLANSLSSLYADFPLIDDGGFVDFHVRVGLGGGLRRVFRPQSTFNLDGLRPFKPLPGKQAFAMLEWGMNWCIYSHAHQFLIIHGAVLAQGGHALILPAPSGSGKSTLCAALMNRGWRLLSDELILVNRSNGTICPLGRPVSLKNQSIEVLRRFAPQAVISEPVHDTAKGSVAHMKPSTESIEQIANPAVPKWVVFPKYRASALVTLTPVSRPDLFMTLVENAFNYSVLRADGFRVMANLVQGVQGFSAEYGDLDQVIEALDQMMGTH